MPQQAPGVDSRHQISIILDLMAYHAATGAPGGFLFAVIDMVRGFPTALREEGLKQSAFASAFSRLKVVRSRFPFFPRTSLHDLCDESPGAGRGPARPRAKTRRLSRG